MRGVLAAADKDIRRFFRDRLALAFSAGTPLLLGGVMLLALGGTKGPAPKVHVLVADEDDSFGSRLLVGAFQQGRAGELIRTEIVDQETGQQRLDQGDASALLIIPDGFAEAVLRESPTQLVLVTNPAQRIMPGIVEEMLSVLPDGVFYAHRLVGTEVREIVEGPPGGGNVFAADDVARVSVSINQTMNQLDRYLAGPAIELKHNVMKRPSSPGVPFAFYYLPSLMMMGLLFVSQGLSADVWREREAGVLRRVMTTPLGVSRHMTGKMVAVATIFFAIVPIVLWVWMSYFELPLDRLPLAVLWSTGVGVQLTAMMLVIQVFATTRRGALVLTYVIMFPLMMVGGSMFPFEIMPRWLATVGRFTPNGWAVEQLKAILLGREGPLSLAAAFPLLLLLAAGFLLLAGGRMARVFARS